jgi:pSer/pThr/pTyr-binding forkhead associated (FHA) protein
MARAKFSITYMSGPLDGKTQEWDVDAKQDEIMVIIGRREGCHILLDYDSQVSRLHARVVYKPKADLFQVEDIGSRNGTFIGPMKLKEINPLQIGELFRIGRTWLRVDPSPEEEVEEDEFFENSLQDDSDDLPF